MSDESMDGKVSSVSESGCVTRPRHVVLGCVRVCVRCMPVRIIYNTQLDRMQKVNERGEEKKYRGE
jgi:glucose-6-phosphate dehydrogenase assembly protein OpcA